MSLHIKLVKLSEQYREQLVEMMDEWLAVEQGFSPYAIRKNDPHDFDKYLKELEIREENGKPVPNSVFFCLDLDRNIFVGAVNIRHCLTERLCHTGGHIGDGVRPSERRKGYATAMIALALEECRKLGLRKVLMTCDKDNIGSAKSIMNNGGVLDYEVTEDGVIEQRYWITLEEEIVESPRLLLKREMPADYMDAFAWGSDERVYRYLLANPSKSPKAMRGWIERQDPNAEDRYVMIIRSKEDNHAVGTSGFFYDEERGVWSFAYNIRYDDWGNGYATEATKAMLDYIAEKYGAHVIEAECAEENIGSARVMEKLGMTFAGYASYSKNDGSKTFRSKIYRLTL